MSSSFGVVFQCCLTGFALEKIEKKINAKMNLQLGDAFISKCQYLKFKIHVFSLLINTCYK